MTDGQSVVSDSMVDGDDIGSLALLVSNPDTGVIVYFHIGAPDSDMPILGRGFDELSIFHGTHTRLRFSMSSFEHLFI